MKIAFLTTKYPPVVGGGESHIGLVAEYMHRLGHEVHVITSHVLNRQTKDYPYVIHEIDGFSDTTISFAVASLISTILLDEACDVLHIVNYEALFYYQLLKIQDADTKVVFSSYNTPLPGERIFGGFNDYNLEKLNVQSLLRQVRIDRFIANSMAFMNGLQAVGVPVSKITSIPSAIDLSIFKPGDDSYKNKLANKKISLLCTSRFVSRKGIEYLINALEYLPENYHLNLTGSGSIHDKKTHAELLAEVEKYKSRISLSDERKSVESLVELYQSSDIFVMPSKYEGFGLAALESMACHIPVVTTDVQGLREFVKHERTGLTVEYGNSLQLAEAIMRIANDTDLRQNLVINASRMVHEFYDTIPTIEAYEKLYISICDKVYA